MARNASPWFWESLNCWAVIIGGTRHVLGDHPVNSPPPRKRNGKWVVPADILQRYHAVVAAPPKPPRAAEPTA